MGAAKGKGCKRQHSVGDLPVALLVHLASTHAPLDKALLLKQNQTPLKFEHPRGRSTACRSGEMRMKAPNPQILFVPVL